MLATHWKATVDQSRLKSKGKLTGLQANMLDFATPMKDKARDCLRLAPALVLLNDDAAIVDDADAKGVEGDVDTTKRPHGAIGNKAPISLQTPDGAASPLPHVTDDLEQPWHEVEDLGHVLVERAQRTTAARARAGSCMLACSTISRGSAAGRGRRAGLRVSADF